MRVVSSESVAFEPVTVSGASGCRIRELLTAREGAPTFALRQFEVDEGGSTPFHCHPWEHEVYVLQGAGEVRTATGPRALAPGDAVLVMPDEEHCFANTGQGAFRFLCLIPIEQTCCR